MLWTEKYRPYYLSEIVGQYGFIMDAENWVENKLNQLIDKIEIWVSFFKDYSVKIHIEFQALFEL